MEWRRSWNGEGGMGEISVEWRRENGKGWNGEGGWNGEEGGREEGGIEKTGEW